jgi:hypothetical protein
MTCLLQIEQHYSSRYLVCCCEGSPTRRHKCTNRDQYYVLYARKGLIFPKLTIGLPCTPQAETLHDMGMSSLPVGWLLKMEFSSPESRLTVEQKTIEADGYLVLNPIMLRRPVSQVVGL